MATAEALVDFKAAKADNTSARKPKNNKGGSKKGKNKNDNGGNKEKEPRAKTNKGSLLKWTLVVYMQRSSPGSRLPKERETQCPLLMSRPEPGLLQ